MLLSILSICKNKVKFQSILIIYGKLIFGFWGVWWCYFSYWLSRNIFEYANYKFELLELLSSATPLPKLIKMRLIKFKSPKILSYINLIFLLLQLITGNPSEDRLKKSFECLSILMSFLQYTPKVVSRTIFTPINFFMVFLTELKWRRLLNYRT